MLARSASPEIHERERMQPATACAACGFCGFAAPWE
jgi:hypothetical protein